MKEPLVQCARCKKLRQKAECENVSRSEVLWGFKTGKTITEIMCTPCIDIINQTPAKDETNLL